MKKHLLLMISASLLASCGMNITSSSSDNPSFNSIEESETGSFSSATTENQGSSTSLTPTKGEDGYMILPDSYFPNYSGKMEGKSNSRIQIPEYDESTIFSGYRTYVNGKRVNCYNIKTDTSHTFASIGNKREDSAMLSIGLDGKATISIALSHPIYRTPVIRPTQAGITPKIDKDYRVISFTVYNKGQYTVEFNDYTTPTLHLFVEDVVEDTSMYKNDSSVMYFEEGLHTSSNDSRIPSSGTINLNDSIKTVYLEPGAIVRAAFFAYSLDNVRILGQGVIDGSVYERNATTNSRLIPIDFQYCSNVTIQDVTFTDCAGWCLNLYFLNGATIDNVKIITSRANGDGISVQSCQNVEVKNCFVRTFDDSLVVKNYPKYGNYSIEGTTKHIHFDNCLIFNDLAQCMEIGYETIGSIMEDITFNNITVLHAYHHAVISIHNANNAEVKGVSFENITVEDPSMGKGDGNGRLIDIQAAFSSTWSTNWKNTAVGNVYAPKIKNFLVNTTNTPTIQIIGSLDERDNTAHYVTDPVLEDVSINGNVIDSSYSKLVTNSYVKNLQILKSGSAVSGSHITYAKTSSEIEAEYSSYADFI